MMAPTYPPKCGTILANVLAALLRGERLTSGDAWREYGTSRLAAVVHELRTTYSWPVQSEDVHVLTADDRTAIVSAYYFAPEFLAVEHDV